MLKSLQDTEHVAGSAGYRKTEAKLRSKTKKCEIIAKIKNYLESPARKAEDITRDPEVVSFLESFKLPDTVVPSLL